MNRKGGMLLELMAAIGVMTIIFAVGTAFIFAGISRSEDIKRENVALRLVQDQIEFARSQGVSDLDIGTSSPLLVGTKRLRALRDARGVIHIEPYPVEGNMLKKITATVRWREGKRDRTISLSTVLGGKKK